MTRAPVLPAHTPKQIPGIQLAAEAVSLPIFPQLTREQQAEVVAALAAFFDPAL